MSKQLVRNYVFNPGARTVTFSLPEFSQIDPKRLYLVTDVTTGDILYNFASATGATVTGNVLTLPSVPSHCAAGDNLQILYEYPGAESGRLVMPDTSVLCDDIFDAGPCGWQELYAFPQPDWNTAQAMPLTLSPHGNFGRYALRLTTANVPAACYGGTATAIKRLAHHAQPGTGVKRIVKAEYWWTFGSDGPASSQSTTVSMAVYSGAAPYTVTVTVASAAGLSVGSAITVSGLGGLTNCGGNAIVSAIAGNNVSYVINAAPSGTYTSGGTVAWTFDSIAPRSIGFQLDTEGDTNTQTNNTTAGARAFFNATWQQSLQNGAAQNYTGQWFFNQGSGLAYGAPGYLSPLATPLVASGYYTNFPSNQNKRSQQYSAFIMDTFNGLWLGMQHNDLYYDLTAVPGLGGAPLASVLAPNDPGYQANDFIGGVNAYVTINNLLNGGKGTSWSSAAWMELHRVRVSYL